jgi:hypothetical protein
MKIFRNYALCITLLLVIAFCGCVSTKKFGDGPFVRENKKFLDVKPEAEEVFRVLLTSDSYTVSQMKLENTIKRVDDPGGDKYMCEELRKLDKIDEAREGVISIWLFPDSGNIMKVRPQKPTYLLEVDKILNDDVQRWNFSFPKKIVDPTKLEIRYRVVLQKRQTDDDIIREVREKMHDQQ